MNDGRATGDGLGCVVVGWDGSVASMRALAFATGMARRAAGLLLAVEVRPSVPASDWYAVAGTPVPETQGGGMATMTAEATVALDDHLPRGWRSVTVYGEVADALRRVAEQARADAIVVGQSAHPVRHPFGTVGQRLLRRARRPVIVVP